jgi:hypothetical protein
LAQNTTTAAVAAGTTTTAQLQISKVVIKVEEVVAEAAGLSLRSVAGVVGFIFLSAQQAGGGNELIHEHEVTERQEEAEPAPAAGGAGKGVIPGHPFRGENAARDAFKHLQQFHGIDPNVASERLHRIKDGAGLGGADNVVIGRTGDVYNAQTGERIGSLTQKY